MNDRYPHHAEETKEPGGESDYGLRQALGSVFALFLVAVTCAVMLIVAGVAFLLAIKVLALFGRALGLWG